MWQLNAGHTSDTHPIWSSVCWASGLEFVHCVQAEQITPAYKIQGCRRLRRNAPTGGFLYVHTGHPENVSDVGFKSRSVLEGLLLLVVKGSRVHATVKARGRQL